MIFERPILRPIITPTNHNKSEQSDKPIRIPSILHVTCPKGNCTIGFTFASYYWLQNWREIFKPIIKRGNHNQVINFRQSFELFNLTSQNESEGFKERNPQFRPEVFVF